MRFKLHSRDQGSVLVVTLSFLAVVAIAIAGYLQLVRSQSAFVSRSQAWNAALSLSEAGAEDGFALLNKNQMSFFTSAYAWTNTLSSDGWGPLVNNVTSRTNFVSGSNYYIVSITIPVGGGAPTIDSQGYMQDNSMLFTSADGTGPFFATAGSSSPNNAAVVKPVVVSRKVRIPTTRTNLFNAGISARSTITISGGWTVDSYDSGDTNYSTGGLYDSTKATAHAIVATDSTNSSAVSSAGGALVKGFVKTGPGGSYSLGGNASVGDAAWVSGGNRGVQTGHYANDMNVYFPTVPAPNVSGWAVPITGFIGLTNYTYLLQGAVGNYQILGALSLGSGQSLGVTGGQVNLYVPNNVTVTGTIYIAPGSSLRLFCNGATVTISGQGVINSDGIPANFSYYGTTNNTSFTYSGQSYFAGSVYAPQANVSMAGGSDYAGAIVCNTFTSSGNASFHVDEGLYRNGAGSPYIAASWSEVAAH